MKHTHPTPPMEIQAITVTMLHAMELPPEFLRHALAHLEYKDFRVHEDDATHIIIADINASYPLLGAMVLLRDVVGRTLEWFGGDEGSTMHESRAFLLLRFLESIQEMCWSLSAIAVFKHPDIEPTSFRAHGGRLVLVGNPIGADKIESRAQAYCREKLLCTAISDALEKVVIAGLADALSTSKSTSPSDVGGTTLADLRRFVPFKGNGTVH